jgi:hypothetical protein
MTGDVLVNRIRSVVCTSPFRLVEATDPFTFATVPQTAINGCVRITLDGMTARAGFSYSEERLDEVGVFVARTTGEDAGTTVRSLYALATSLTAAIVRDGCGAGDYAVGDQGRRATVQRDPAASFHVLRLTLPVSYMLSL